MKTFIPNEINNADLNLLSMVSVVLHSEEFKHLLTSVFNLFLF
ncbi:hypothetical protein SAMN05720766_101195 [Fibrobacter sp. UWH9]|nr:hypothetical protein SAMN05720766_101195 [Fibrobacter sp. UWH9]